MDEVPDIVACKTPYEAAEGADALVIATPWNEFKQLDMERIKEALKTPILLDGRNMYEPEKMRNMGFVYRALAVDTTVKASLVLGTSTL